MDVKDPSGRYAQIPNSPTVVVPTSQHTEQLGFEELFVHVLWLLSMRVALDEGDGERAERSYQKTGGMTLSILRA